MNTSEIEKGRRVYDKEDNSALVVIDAGLGRAEDYTFKGQSVFQNNTRYPKSDEVVEVVYKSDVLNHSSIDEGFSIDSLLEYEENYNVLINRYYFPISRLRPT